MKKFLFICALLCATVSVSAQDSQLSVKVGVGLSSVAGDDSEGAKNALSYKVGVGYEYAFSDNFAIEPALMLVNKSMEIEGVEGAINRYYAELPILAAFKVALGDETKLVINAGPYVAYGLFGTDIEWYDGGTTNIFDSCERFEAGAQAGIKIAFGDLSIGADFTRAFTKCIKDSKTYTQGFGLTFGYSF